VYLASKPAANLPEAPPRAVGSVGFGAKFIFNHAAALKGFVDIAFHDPALGRIIDAIAQAVSSMPPIGP
jgi:hypothetical protein